MGTPLRALIVEDNDSDLILLIRALTQGGYEVKYKQVQNSADLRTALQEEVWDAIFIDFNLPDFNALDALAIIKARDVDIPRIVMSGTVGEETAVKVMRAGAHDFIPKDNLARLIPALQRELADTLQRQAHGRDQGALHLSEEQFRRIFDQGHLGMAMVGFNGHLLRVNKAICRLLGYSEAEMLERYFQDLAGVEEKEHNQQMVTELFEGRIPAFNLEKRYLRKDGREVWADLYISIVMDSHDAPIFAAALFQDVTERHRYAETLRDSDERYRIFSEVGREGILIHKGGLILDANQALQKMLGYSLEELHKLGLNDLLPPQSTSQWEKHLLVANANPIRVQIKCRDGSILHIDASSQTTQVGSQPAIAVVIRS